jgi:hypothetical protein
MRKESRNLNFPLSVLPPLVHLILTPVSLSFSSLFSHPAADLCKLRRINIMVGIADCLSHNALLIVSNSGVVIDAINSQQLQFKALRRCRGRLARKPKY